MGGRHEAGEAPAGRSGERGGASQRPGSLRLGSARGSSAERVPSGTAGFGHGTAGHEPGINDSDGEAEEGEEEEYDRGEEEDDEEDDAGDVQAPDSTEAEDSSPQSRARETDDGASLMSQNSIDLKERQERINKSHPFGIRIWKPAIYKKSRSVQRSAEGDIHSAPGSRRSKVISNGNFLWSLFFGWWMFLLFLVPALAMLCIRTRTGRRYGSVYFGLAVYIFYPFGRYLELRFKPEYADEDEGRGHNIEDYLTMENEMVLDPQVAAADPLQYTAFSRRKFRLFGRGKWSVSRVVFYILFYTIVAPILQLVSLLCWFLIFAVPMSKVCHMLYRYIQNHPLQLEFHDSLAVRDRLGEDSERQRSALVLLCTYRAFGRKYFKYTLDGTNIIFINLMALVIFTIADEYVLKRALGHTHFFANDAFIFVLSLASTVPLAYFIGQAVASISAQSSMGMGAAINAFFGSVVEVFLYSVALIRGKGRLVEGSVIGSILAGVLLMPGLSMCAGALKRKTQRFNIKSASVNSTMLLFAVLGCFAPTLFYQIYGTYELRCAQCSADSEVGYCARCEFDQATAVDDPFYLSSIKPFTYWCSIFLILCYMIGLWFTLRTHSAMIWQAPAPSAAPPVPHSHSTGPQPSIPQPQFHQRPPLSRSNSGKNSLSRIQSPLAKTPGGTIESIRRANLGSSVRRVPSRDELNDDLLRPHDMTSSISEHDERRSDSMKHMRSVAVSAAFQALQDYQDQASKRLLKKRKVSTAVHSSPMPAPAPATDFELGEAEGHEGHDAPNWSRVKSAVILLGSTLLYAVIAEILVNKVDIVLENVSVDEKFLGFTLFALVPNTTEFMNAISFALNGNVALRYVQVLNDANRHKTVSRSARHTHSRYVSYKSQHSWPLVRTKTGGSRRWRLTHLIWCSRDGTLCVSFFVSFCFLTCIARARAITLRARFFAWPML